MGQIVNFGETNTAILLVNYRRHFTFVTHLHITHLGLRT